MRSIIGVVTVLVITMASPSFAQTPEPLPAAFAKFYTSFAKAVTSNDHEAVAALAKLPMSAPFHKTIIRTKADFLKSYDALFPTKQRQCLAKSHPMTGDDCEDCFILYCDKIYYGFDKFRGGYRLFVVGENE